MEIKIEELDFSKGNGLIPTIVKDEQGIVLMLAYSSKESLLMALEMRKGVYFSRSRNKLWFKGESSGNTQELLDVKTDCDKDALLFIVNQTGTDGACHLKRYSCFEETKKFDLEELYGKLKERINSRDKTSYTLKLTKDPKLLYKKIREEARELTQTKNKNQVMWEAADLLYFVTTLLVKRGVSFESVFEKLKERNKKAKKLNKTLKEANK
jgi:phosphoribosyl-ATP pyrophosphohydrolase/phosphoribosyl-AMP cyclohydrolase/histidinol dehydrogenase